jgi:hypothetical protein
MSHKIIRNKLIPLNSLYDFTFSEEREKNTHPVSNYFLKLNDLSINLLISLKWIRWGYFFFSSLSENLNGLDDTYSIKSLVLNSIQGAEINEIKKVGHIMLIDNNIVDSTSSLEKLIDDLYSSEVFDENSRIHLKLKINLDEYLTISNYLHPTLVKFERLTL